jgi:release factor glutamine methyltransferase
MAEPAAVLPVEEEADFGGLAVRFDQRVLRPRPWTTAQSYWAADLLARSPEGPVLELCAGVGHIGLLAVMREPRHLVMVDADPVACRYARRNAAGSGVPGTTEVRLGPLDDVLGHSERFVGVIADPPWVTSAEITRFPDDPVTAIDGGQDGLDVAWLALETAAGHLLPGRWVLLQLGSVEQARVLEERLGTEGLELESVEVREYGDRGVLVHLVRL